MEEILQQIQNSLADKSDTEKISFLNELKNALISFFPLHEPVDAVIWVRSKICKRMPIIRIR